MELNTIMGLKHDLIFKLNLDRVEGMLTQPLTNCNVLIKYILSQSVDLTHKPDISLQMLVGFTCPLLVLKWLLSVTAADSVGWTCLSNKVNLMKPWD